MKCPEKKKIFLIIFIVSIIIISIIICMCNNNSKLAIQTSSNENLIGQSIILTGSMKKELYQIVKTDIIDSLKTPASASFPKMKEWNIEVDNNNVIEIKSYVDSQNSYGAMLRGNFEQHYIPINTNKYLCIYKEFNNEVQYDITEDAENKKVLNKNITKNQINDFIKNTEKNQYNTLYNKVVDYTFDEENQELVWNIKVTSQIDGDIKSNCYAALTSAIDECICIPTVKTTINVYFYEKEKKQKIATVKDIDFNFLTEKWNILSNTGTNTTHLTTDFEKELGEKLVQGDMIKNMKVDYWNK